MVTRPSSRELAIVRSVIYASLFDYPMTIDQLHQALLESDQTPPAILTTYRASTILQSIIEYRDGYFFPSGCDELLGERRRRETRSKAFLARHALLLRLVCAMPYVRMVALSGSVAHLNMEGTGDLDLFIVTRGQHVWSATVAVLVLAKLMRRRRIVCANFVMADSRLALEQQDLFTANQVIHLKPLVGHGLFREFVAANPFVKRFYPNFRPVEPPGGQRPGALDRAKAAVEVAFSLPSRLVEAVCRQAYTWHLRRRSASWRSPAQVRLERDYLKLHTRSHRQDTLDRFELAVQLAIDRAGQQLERPAAAVGMPASARR